MDNDITIEISNIENYTIQLNEQGPQGIAGPPGADGPQGPQGEDGEAGVGITGIEKTSTAGLVDTYTITYSDGASSTYEVTNGKDATVNGYNAVTITASDGISLSQSDDDITIRGASIENKIGDLTTLTTTDKTDLVSALNELNSNKQDAVTFSTGLTDTAGTITVTDYDKLIKNDAVGLNAIVIGGGDETVSAYSVVLGNGAKAGSLSPNIYNAQHATAIGADAESMGQYAIQIGKGKNTSNRTLAVGFGSNNGDILEYQLLDGFTGYIPNARINMDTTPTDSSTNAITSGAVYTALSGKSTVSGTHDGTNWSTITIDGTTKNIPSGGGGSATDVQINGTSIVVSGVANILTETAYNASSNKIATMADTKQAVTALSGTSITLTDNSVNTLTPTGNTTFTLPTVSDTTTFHQILVQLNLSTVYTIDLGTTTYFGGTTPDLSATGNYNLIYEYDNALSTWVVGAVSKS